MTGPATRAVHGDPSATHPHGALRPPLFDSAAFEFASSAELEAAFAGRKPAHTYTRVTNPTVHELERRVQLLTGARGVIAVSSGMSAIADTVLALAGPGSTIVTSRHLFSHTLSLFCETLGRWGLQVRFVDMRDLSQVAASIDTTTSMLFLESITNPQLEVADIGAISQIASRSGVPVVLDGTLTTPALFDARSAGVAVEVISSTKFISGGATSVGGLIVDTGVFDWTRHAALADLARKAGPAAFMARVRRDVSRNIGTCLAPHNAWLQTLGLETLALRVRTACHNALEIATWLERQSQVRSVNYPGLPSSPSHTLAAKQFSAGFGGIVTFDLADRAACYRFMDALHVVRRATNINDNKSLIIHPASTIFSDFTASQLSELGVSDATIRFSAGIEDTADLIEDLQRGLGAL